jgi:hypothetical protein
MLKLLWPIPGGPASAQVMLNYLYKSEELENALQDTFGSDERLFSHANNDRQATNKVAVIATGEEEERPYLLTNYNREWLMNNDESKDFSTNNLRATILMPTDNNLRREERPKDELRTWEV